MNSKHIKLTICVIVFLSHIIIPVHAQHEHGLEEAPFKKIVFSGFGEVHYNQPIGNNHLKNGKLDIHRLVVGMGYRFDKHFSFMTEIAYEHVSEVLIEQMYINYKKSNLLQIKTGLLPVPMGIVNQEHEPVQFNGVEHPFINEHIIPTAWREIGIGIHGELEQLKLHYQLYAINGFSSYKNNEGLASGMNAFRTARQEGVESFISHPNFTGRLAYEGIKDLEIGTSFYLGKTQSELYDSQPKIIADSSVVRIGMGGIDLRYKIQNFHIRGECVYANINNTEAYNKFTSQDLGKGMLGYYGEIAYDISKDKWCVTPFYRYENNNTHFQVDKSLIANSKYNRTCHTLGVTYTPIPHILLKADYQWVNDAAKNKYDMLNIGVNFIFGS